MSWEMEIHIWTNVLPLVVIASISFTCDVIIIKATADVNPDDTGPETKSIIKPEMKMRFAISFYSNPKIYRKLLQINIRRTVIQIWRPCKVF